MGVIPSWAFIAIAVVVVVVVIIVLFKMMWRVAGPSEALIISGRKSDPAEGVADSMEFRIVSGKGTFVVPLLEHAETLDLTIRQVDLHVECPTSQGVEVGVEGVVIFKIGDDEASISNAARRFLGQQQQMERQITEVFAGHLRSIVGGMTVEDMIRNRTELTEQTRDASAKEVQALGLVIDSLQIKQITDPSKYIENIAAPNLARVKRDARIAQAEADQQANAAEQLAIAQKAEADRETSLKVAGISAEVEAKQAEARQQGPLAEARAKQQVLEQETALATRQTALREQQLNAEVRASADAKAYATVKDAEAAGSAAIKKAEADAQATRISGEALAESNRAVGIAEAEVIKAKGEAEGEALSAKAKGVAEGQEGILAQIRAEQLPEVVRAAAAAFNNVGSLTVFDGAEGMERGMLSIVGMATKAWSQLQGATSDLDQPSSTKVDAVEQ